MYSSSLIRYWWISTSCIVLMTLRDISMCQLLDLRFSTLGSCGFFWRSKMWRHVDFLGKNEYWTKKNIQKNTVGNMPFQTFFEMFYYRLLSRLWLSQEGFKRKCLVVGTGFWTSILPPVFWAGLSQITRFWTNRIPAAVPVLKSRLND